MVKRAKAPTAYMLIYRAQAAAGGCGAQVPEAARELVESVNASLNARKQQEAERLNRLPCTVRWNSQGQGGVGVGVGGGEMHELSLVLSKTHSLDAAAAEVEGALASSLPAFSTAMARLRLWDNAAAVPSSILPWSAKRANAEGETLRGLLGSFATCATGSGPQRLELFVEVLQKPEDAPGMSCMSPYEAGWVTLRVVLFTAAAASGDACLGTLHESPATCSDGNARSHGTLGQGSLAKPRYLSVPAWGATCQELAERVHECLGIPPSMQSWVLGAQDAGPVHLLPVGETVCVECVTV
jgi:hypothetical protein